MINVTMIIITPPTKKIHFGASRGKVLRADSVHARYFSSWQDTILLQGAEMQDKK